MFYGNTVQDTRTMFFSCWNKYQNKQALSALEQQIVAVLLDHPEYHAVMAQAPDDHRYFPELGESNPFLHMGLHLAIREQISTDRPAGIQALFQQLLITHQEPLTVEHLMMERLAECLWLAQKNNKMPDEHEYLAFLAQINQ